MGNAGLEMAKVVGVHPEAYAVDILLLRTGARVPMVQVMSWSASSNTGAADLPAPTPPAAPYDPQDTKDRDTYAIVGFAGGFPVVLGFLFPQVCQMLFADINRKVERHASDWYTTVDGDGNFEASHPSGTYLRIGTSPAHDDLTARDFDRKWKITKNTDKAVHVHLSVKSGGVEKASISISPTGNIAVSNTGTLAIQTTGAASLSVGGALTTSAASWAHTGDINVTGAITATVNVTGGGKSLKTHTHGGVTAGGALTGQPS